MNKSAIDKSEYLTPDEVAGLFRVSAQTVLNWVRAGRLRGIMLSPRVIRIPRSEVERVQQEQGPVPRELLEPRPWQEVLREYEQYFAMSTEEMLRLRAEGRVPDMRTGEDERLYDAWLGAAQMALAAGLIAPPMVSRNA